MLNEQTIERITAEEANLGADFGWDTPDYLFGLSGLRQELWLEMPGGAEAFLTALGDLGVGVGAGVDALVVVMSTGYDPGHDIGLPPLGTLRRACEDAGVAPEMLLDRLPRGGVVRSSRRLMRAVVAIQRHAPMYVIVREWECAAMPMDVLPGDFGDHANLYRQALRVLQAGA